jgi:hypothetical protein
MQGGYWLSSEHRESRGANCRSWRAEEGTVREAKGC